MQSAATEGKNGNPLYTAQISDESYIFGQLGITNPSVPFEYIAQTLHYHGNKLGIAPLNANDPVTSQLAVTLSNYFQQKVGNYYNFIHVFTSQNTMEDYITTKSYNDPGYGFGKIAFGIILNSIDVTTGQWDYSIRTNYTNTRDQTFPTVACLTNYYNCKFVYTIPSTKFYTDELSRPGLIDYINGYLYSGFSTLQQSIDEFIFSRYGQTTKVTASVSPMPTSAFVTDSFQAVIKSTLAIFYMLSFLYPVSRIIRAIVLDKETRIKESMKIMGLSDTVYGLSWFLTIFIQMTFISILITLVTSTSIYEYSNKFIVFLFFELFSISIINLCFLLTTLFNRSKVASLIGPMIFFSLFFPYYAVNDPQFSTQIKLSSCLLAPTCFALGIEQFALYEGSLIGIQFNNINQLVYNFDVILCLTMLFVDCIIYGLLAWYFDKVLPSEFGTPLPTYFFLLPRYWINDIQLKWFRSFFWDKSVTYSQLNTSEQLNDELLSDNVINHQKELNYIQTPNRFIEAIPNELLSQIEDLKTLSIRGLTKVFKSTNGKQEQEHTAVDNLHADLFEGQVTVLLGHNGSGT